MSFTIQTLLKAKSHENILIQSGALNRMERDGSVSRRAKGKEPLTSPLEGKLHVGNDIAHHLPAMFSALRIVSHIVLHKYLLNGFISERMDGRTHWR